MVTRSQRLPAAILARALGIHISVAASWQCACAGDWLSYAAEISRRGYVSQWGHTAGSRWSKKYDSLAGKCTVDTAAIPHPPHRLPVLGDVLGMNPRAPLQSSLRLARDLGPISVRSGLGVQLVMVGGAELAAELNDDTRFRKHVALHLTPLRRITGHALFTAENAEPNWQLAHDILAPAFTREAMRGYHTIMLEVARELLARWDTAAAGRQRVDVTADMTRLTLETIGRAGFGYRFGSFDRDRPIRSSAP